MIRLAAAIAAVLAASVALAGKPSVAPRSIAAAKPASAAKVAPTRKSSPATQPFTIELAKVGGYTSSVAGSTTTAAEIVAYDAGTRRAFLINTESPTVDVVDLSNPAVPTLAGVIDVSYWGPKVNSVDVYRGKVAIAVEAAVATDAGKVVLFSAVDLQQTGPAQGISVGAMPDMVTFADEGELLLVANEGEPAGTSCGVDPEGSVTIIELDDDHDEVEVRTADFSAWNGREDELRAQGVRIFGNYGCGASSAAQDLEPEYIAVDGKRAYVTLQENDAIAVIDLERAKVLSILPLGYKDHSLAANKLDASDRDSAINIANWPVFGMYQPDGIAALRGPRGQSLLVLANEGDARSYSALNEESRVSTLTLDPTAFPTATALKANAALGRLTVTNRLGDTDGDGDFDRLYAFGGRSVSIRDSAGNLLWDSGDLLERVTAAALPANFNASNDKSAKDDRSDNKGPEPEGVVVGRVASKTYAFIGLERIGGVAVLDVSNPTAPAFVQYVTSRSFPASGIAGDSGPEGLKFVSAEQSPSGKPLLLVGNETSRTLAVFEISTKAVTP